MYCYIYDTFVSDKKYQTTINRIETRLMDLGINGRTEKLTILKNIKEIVQEATSRGTDTVVAVGNDSTVTKIISSLPHLNVTLGLIPLGDGNRIAQVLGIPLGEKACDVISARIIEKIDLGKANNCFFITSLDVPAGHTTVLDYGTFRVSPTGEHQSISICNFGYETKDGRRTATRSGNPKDGVLEAIVSGGEQRDGFLGFFKRTYSPDSVFPFTKLKIKSEAEPLPVIADGQTTIKTPLTVEVVPKKLKVIVGKNRMF